jgi:propionyl-CoA synthetase
MINNKLGKAYFHSVIVVENLPISKNGKILRESIKSIANHDEFTMPSTIDESTVHILDEIKNSFFMYEITNNEIGNK